MWFSYGNVNYHLSNQILRSVNCCWDFVISSCYFVKMSKKPLWSQARNIVYNVYRKISEEEGVNQTQSLILERVVELTGKLDWVVLILLVYFIFFLLNCGFFAGVPSTTIRRIVGEGTSNDGVFSTPGKKRRGGKKKINLDSFDLELIRNKVKDNNDEWLSYRLSNMINVIIFYRLYLRIRTYT